MAPPSAALQRIPADHPAAAAAAAAVAALRQDGACIVSGMFTAPGAIATMRSAVRAKATKDAEGDAKPGSASQGYIDAVDTLTDSAPPWVVGFVGANTVRFSSLGKIGGADTRAAYFSLLDNPLYKDVADAMLLPFTGSYWVNTAQAMLIGPGSEAQPLHRDADNCKYIAMHQRKQPVSTGLCLLLAPAAALPDALALALTGTEMSIGITGSQMFERTWAGADTVTPLRNPLVICD